MAKEKVCVSFDFEHDYYYYELLKAWDKNKNFEFTFSDCTPKEIQTESVSVVKQVLSKKFGEANYIIVIIGAHSDEQHPNSKEIGYKNWQAYEIAKNYEKGNGIVIVKINKSYSAPDEAYGIGAIWVDSFNESDIVAVLQELSKNQK